MAPPLHKRSAMQTIELSALENVTGGRRMPKAPKPGTFQKVFGKGMEIMNFGFNAMMGLDLVNMGIQGGTWAYNKATGKKSEPAKPAQPALEE